MAKKSTPKSNPKKGGTAKSVEKFSKGGEVSKKAQPSSGGKPIRPRK